MEKNYYEILEVDKNASKEIIDKAYKTLAKKYHPDLQEDNIKKEFEEKMKILNEAYDILSDDIKRNEYDESIVIEVVPMQEYQRLLYENQQLKEKINELNYIYNNVSTNQNINNYYQNEINQTDNDLYNDLYNDGYDINNNIKYNTLTFKEKVKEKFKGIIAIAIMIVLLLLLSKIPFINKFLIKIYEENIIIKEIVNAFKESISLIK